MRLLRHTNILFLVVVCCSNCGSRRTLSVDDAGNRTDGRITNTCKRPAGRCASYLDCPSGVQCLKSNDVDCDIDPCCDQTREPSSSKRGYGLMAPEPPADRVGCGCLGTCAAECTANADCADDQFCSFKEGTCGTEPGICRSRSECTVGKRSGALPPGAGERPIYCGCDGTTYFDLCAVAAAGTSISFFGECPHTPPIDDKCAKTTCYMVDDCYSCEAVREGEGPMNSPLPCSESLCSEWGVVPEPYCHQGACLVADGGRSCNSDAECILHNDCCYCTALLVGTTLPDCAADCDRGRCLGDMQLLTPIARCIKGRCQVASE